MAFPRQLIIRVSPEPPEGPPPSDILLELQFLRNGQTVYAFEVGPTDGDGLVIVTEAELESRLNDARRQSLMDYRVPLSDIDGIRVTLMPEEQIRMWLVWDKERREWRVPAGLAEQLRLTTDRIQADDELTQKYLNVRNAQFLPTRKTVSLSGPIRDRLTVTLKARLPERGFGEEAERGDPPGDSPPK